MRRVALPRRSFAVRGAAAGAAVLAALSLSACSAPASDAPAQDITYRIVVTGPNQTQASAVAYYTAPSPGKASVRAKMGTVPLAPVEGKDASFWQTKTTVTEGARIELTAAPPVNASTATCIVLVDGNDYLSATGEPGKPVTCTNQPDARN